MNRSEISTRDLLEHYGDILRELRSRGVVRSYNNPAADIAECALCVTYLSRDGHKANHSGTIMDRRTFVEEVSTVVGAAPVALIAMLTACGGDSSESDAEPARAGTPQRTDAQPWQGTVLQAQEGHFIVSGRRRAPMRIKVDSREASGAAMSMLISEVPPGTKIPVHSHRNEDEIIFIHAGEGIVTLGDREVRSSAGAMLYAPRGVWHGVDNIGSETLTWCAIWSPGGFEQYFVEVAPLLAEGQSPAQAQLDAVAAKYGMSFRDI